MTLYQHTPHASKNNAFCWLSWAPLIHWSSHGEQRGAKTSEAIERKRSEGIDPLYIPSLGGNVTRDPARFALTTNERTPWRKRGELKA